MHQMGQRYLEHVLSVCNEAEEPQSGNLVLYHFGKCISQGAIVVEWPNIIHSCIHLVVILQDGTKGSLACCRAGFFSYAEAEKMSGVFGSTTISMSDTRINSMRIQ